MKNTIRAFEKVNRNLYKTETCYWRLFANGITPNGCWLINPKMVELKDIDVGTGSDIYGAAEVEFEFIGTVTADSEYIRY